MKQKYKKKTSHLKDFYTMNFRGSIMFKNTKLKNDFILRLHIDGMLIQPIGFTCTSKSNHRKDWTKHTKSQIFYRIQNSRAFCSIFE